MRLSRGSGPGPQRADSQATPGRCPSSVRLISGRPDRAIQPRCLGARAEPQRPPRKDAGASLAPAEARQLLDAIDVGTPAGLRDRALIGLMTYSFARVGAALAMRVEDVYVQNRRLWVRLHEKGGKRHDSIHPA